ncbi:hypothetical protein PIB30_038771 [Stylosanthes scabra]|uniref:TF-B3 domain-containing protein n=1 Tax=Stylosanthes scabra TaxID=79078 RepID=A0ABU6XBS2_9FABA|nr:hypothetical protein [Stylosanthes scabra]
MEWEKCGADVWFVKDWKKFAEFYSLENEQVLMFKYEGKSRFNVIILGRSCLEREYPLLNETLEAEDDSMERPNSPSRCSSKKRRTNTKEEARLYSSQHGETKGAQSRWPSTEKKKFNAYSDTGRPKDTGGRRIFSKSEASNNFEAPKDTKSSSALERAMALASNNLWFYREMKPAYLNNYLLFKKGDFIKQEGKEENFLSLWVTDENKTWDAKITKDDTTGQIMLTTGWKDFVEANNLKLNDVCIFEKTGNSRGLLYRVIIHHAKEESTHIPSQVTNDVDVAAIGPEIINSPSN